MNSVEHNWNKRAQRAFLAIKAIAKKKGQYGRIMNTDMALASEAADELWRLEKAEEKAYVYAKVMQALAAAESGDQTKALVLVTRAFKSLWV